MVVVVADYLREVASGAGVAQILSARIFVVADDWSDNTASLRVERVGRAHAIIYTGRIRAVTQSRRWNARIRGATAMVVADQRRVVASGGVVAHVHGAVQPVVARIQFVSASSRIGARVYRARIVVVARYGRERAALSLQINTHAKLFDERTAALIHTLLVQTSSSSQM